MAGLKGKSMGGAKISNKHAGFIINSGKATANDVLKLIEYIKLQIKDHYGFDIEEEIEIM